jgi:hypothetical protein
MLIQSMSVTTDETSEFALNMTVSLREIIITYVQQTSGQSDTPSQTTPQKDAGNTTPKLEDNVPIPPSRPSDLGSVPPATGGGTSPTPPTWEPGDSGPPPPSPPPPIVLSPDPSLPNPDQPWQSLPPPAPPSAPQMGPESPGVGILPGTSGSAESPAPLPPGVITTDPGLVWGGT